MASESGGGRVAEIEFSSMKQPPLIKQLKGILSEYPDGGQILKEVIQNAEDAEASEIRMIYNSRRINDSTDAQTPAYNRFFKGPSLCIYNDALFTDKDWDGIRMIYSSVKEDDPLTVGRFGLGFKSVFHITDYPCVISGSKMLLIDPKQPADKVNAMIYLEDIGKLEDKGLNAESFWKALDGLFGFNKECAEKGYFNGTIFWFSLREKPSEISETLYYEEKVLDLFDGFEKEAPSILLFLKNLQSISVSVIDSDELVKEKVRAEIEDSSGKLKQSRSKFKEKIKLLASDYKGEDVTVDLQMTIKTTKIDTCEFTRWQIVNYFVGNSASKDFKKLIQDADLGYSPYVGVATPLSNVDEFEGHVFCFLPLPHEGSKLTGLPVHVNGFFALSQNRHHLKWETDEQKGKRIDDKSILWNRFLIREALPKAYSRLLQSVVDTSTSLGNPDDLIAAVYRCFPLSPNVQNRWKILETEFYKRVKKLRILYSKYKKKWVTIADASFASFNKLPDNQKYVQNAVVRCLNIIGKVYIDISLDVLSNLRKHFPDIKNTTPDSLAKHLRQNAAYKNLSNSDKLDVLLYICNERNNYELLEGLELLPLASGGWTTFKKQRESIYLGTDKEVEILEGLEKSILLKSASLGTLLSNHMEQVCANGSFQIKHLTAADFGNLLESTVAVEVGTNPCITDGSKLSLAWLQKTWTYCIDRNYLLHLNNVHIVPVLTKGSWDAPYLVELALLSDMLLVKCNGNDILPEGLCNCFGNMGVRVLESLPPWIPKHETKTHFYWPSQKSVLSLLTKMGSHENVDEKTKLFNDRCNWNDKSVFTECISRIYHSLTKEGVNFLRKVKIFNAIDSLGDKGIDVSLEEINCYIDSKVQFPDCVRFARRYIKSDNSNFNLLTTLGASKLELEDLVLATLTDFQKPSNPNDIPKFMNYFIESFHLFHQNETIIKLASDVSFLKAGTQRCKASDLFDPSDTDLQELLFDEALLPETKKSLTNEKIRILKFLGLKGHRDITADVIFKVAHTLDELSEEEQSSRHYFSKANALMKFLMARDTLLDEKCTNGLTLLENLKNLSCIPVQAKRVPTYPMCVQWNPGKKHLCIPSEANESCNSHLVGAIKPIVVCMSSKVNSKFRWQASPAIENVISQLRIVSASYDVQNRPDIIPLIKSIYQHLSNRTKEVWKHRHAFANKKIIWNGSDFSTVDKTIVVQSPNDLDLYPYYTFVASEFQTMQQLFLSSGCQLKQDFKVLLDTLQQIKLLHITRQVDHIITRDRHIICKILDKICTDFKQDLGSCKESDILIMVHDNDPNCLRLLPLPECTYDDDPTYYYELDENIHLVHEMISPHIVEALGVKSISRKALMDGEELGIEEWGQQEPLTTRLHALLRDGYMDGLSVPKELIQNADDAGATVVKFLYDERQNANLRQRVFSKGMKHFQGPALWIYNDAQFTSEDLKNITKLNAATKQTDVKKIGKFGLGFCSVYNLTDLPSFLSGSDLVFFDPHEKYLGNVLRSKGTGLKYRLPNKNLVNRHIDQFMPYCGIFGCKINQDDFTEYKGTLFRLPLRNEQLAKESLISSLSYTHEEMITLLQMFVKTAGNLLLFTQHVEKIEIHHLPGSALSTSDQKLIYSIERASFKWQEGFFTPTFVNVLARMPKLLDSGKEFREIHKLVFKQTTTRHAKCLLYETEENTDNIETKWITSWASGNRKCSQMYKQLCMEGALPLSAVAVPFIESDGIAPLKITSLPCGFYNEGHIFCFLPLPLKTKLQIHINGYFSVTSDRRQLSSLTEDDKRNKRNSWNIALMEDSVVTAFLYLIQSFATKHVKMNSGYMYYDLWPGMCSSIVQTFKEGFYRKLIENNVQVFKGGQKWVSFQHAVFLDPFIRESDIGEIAFEVLSKFPPRQGKTLIEMPTHLFENIQQNNKGHENYIRSNQVLEEELFLTFLETLKSGFWDNRQSDRNKVIYAALKCQKMNVKQKMKEVACIPTEPNHILARPCDLIHPNSHSAILFGDKEEVFPLKIKEFRKESTLKRLIELGMITTSLSSSLLIDRCRSVLMLAQKCFCCAEERFVNLMKYFAHTEVLTELKRNTQCLDTIRDMFLFPVLPKPKGWTFSWKADTEDTEIKVFNKVVSCKNHVGKSGQLLLGKSKHLFRENAIDFAGIVCAVVDESYMFPLKENKNNSEKLIQLVGIRDQMNIPLNILAQQICAISREYTDAENQFENVTRIHDRIFRHLEKSISVPETIQLTKQSIEMIKNVRFVLVGNDLLFARNVAFNIKDEIKPYLYRLPDVDRINKKNVYSCLGVQQYFNVETIIEVMVSMKQICEKADCIDLFSSLLTNLDESMHQFEKNYDDLKQFHENIIAPDIHGMLFPTNQLAIENEDYTSTSSMKILHHSIPPAVAKRLGAKMKQLRCYQEIKVGISFGQREELVTRIKGLLKAYPCDSSIMKELLQNADDAGATEIHFVKDYRQHSTKKLFSTSCDVLQGPSLCVYNNSYFTKSDIIGIHNLGQGSKSDDPSKTGQYGVGFNAVYHLTDTPSFITKGPPDSDEGLMFIFDPLCKYVPQATSLEPGVMCKLTDLESNFSDHLLGFLVNEFINDAIGTVFRLPLRTVTSEISDERITRDEMDAILHSFEDDMFESVLFLKNIKRIKISNVTSGRLIEEYSVEVQLSEKAEMDRRDFQKEVFMIDKLNRNNREYNLEREPIEIVYEMNVTDTRNKSKHWVIVQRFGMHGEIEGLDEIKKSFTCGDLGLLPAGGVAIHLNENLHSLIRSNNQQNMFLDDCQEQKKEEEKNAEFRGRAFCFLPLPIYTGLPVHVNGHFALDHEARRDLWKDGYRMRWNTCILNGVITPAWISGLTFISNLLTPVLQNAKKFHVINVTLLDYHRFFPSRDCTSDIWTNVSMNFFKKVHDTKAALFPCIFENNPEITGSKECIRQSKRYRPVWVPVKTPSEDKYFGVFNTVQNEMSHKFTTKFKDVRLIVNLLKSFGMQLIESPNNIRLAMVKAGIENVPTSSPSTIISFLKSFENQTVSNCDFGPIGCHISETKFTTPRNVFIFMDFLMHDKDFCKQMIGLPLRLTADSVLQVYSETHTVFVSSYIHLLSKCADMFVHEEILDLLQNSHFMESPIFKEFKFEDFVQLLPRCMDADVYANGLEISFKDDETKEIISAISIEWITLFYDFLSECSTTSSAENKTSPQRVSVMDFQKRKIDSDLLLENIRLLGTWSFLPCTSTDKKHRLVPMKEICHVLHLSALDKVSKTGNCLAKFNIPRLYSNAFNKCRAQEDIQKSMENVVASLKRPYDLLCCLSHHKPRLEASEEITEEDGVELLAFFDRELNVLEKFASKETLVSFLCQLPFYLTMQGTLISLAGTENVLVLPKGMPFNGIQIWANTCNIILLQERDSLLSLYDFLGLVKADEDYVYGQKILPQLNAMPSQYWMEHITYLRDKLGGRLNMTQNQCKIINELKTIAFIRVGSEMKMAKQLYDQSNKTFNCLVNSNECLPSDMSSQEWTTFLEKIGLKTRVTDEMMLLFARQIESMSLNGSPPEMIRKKSEVLLDRFVENNGLDWNKTTLGQLRTIKFIYPFVLEDDCNRVAPQYSEKEKTICFYGAISSANSDLCWSSANLCPVVRYNKLDGNVRTNLGLLGDPPVEKVVIHCHNIIATFKTNLHKGNISDAFVKKKMSGIYEYLSGQAGLNDQIISRLRGKPFIHLPEDNDIVFINEVVVDLLPTLEIKPYLYKAPSYYGKYYELFQQIGSKQSVTFCHYSSILQKIKHQCKDNKMSVPERAIVKSVFRGLIELKLDKDTSAEDVTSVFLPTQQLYLKDSKHVVISNKFSFEMRLRGNVELDICVDMSFLDIKSPSIEEACSKWPNHLRPILLTDVVHEDVCLEDSSNPKLKHSKKARKIKQFLHSNELVTALCRLMKHQSARKVSDDKFDSERTETEIAKNLRSVNVIEFPSLRTVLKYKGKRVEGSERNISYHIQESDGNESRPCTLFFNDKSKTDNVDLPKISHGILTLLTKCAKDLNADSITHVTSLIHYFEYPHKLHSILDDLNILHYGSPQATLQDYFPKPGTYVEPQFIPFLEQGIIPFKDFEFEHVAMELEDDSLERDDDDYQTPVYIYVKILREEIKTEGDSDDLERIYIVETGQTDFPSERVPIYRLYRFIRKDAGTKLEVYTGKKQTDQMSIDEQCRKLRRELKQAWKLPEKDRKRIVRRILLKWHPDKNRGNEDYCTKIFQYIQIIISRLENGEPLEDDVEEEMRRGKSQFSQSSSAFYENVFKKARTYARAYYDNFDAYSKSERTGSYAHSTAETVKRPDHGEAKRWLRQAKNDFQTASEMFPISSGTSSYNWVCYICHQVCEKALKATHYSNDANNVPDGVYLPMLALTADMRDQVSLLENRLGAHGRLRYPDALSRPKIPSDLFTKDDAEFSLEVAKNILEMVEEYI